MKWEGDSTAFSNKSLAHYPRYWNRKLTMLRVLTRLKEKFLTKTKQPHSSSITTFFSSMTPSTSKVYQANMLARFPLGHKKEPNQEKGQQ
jgi:hypothetical protein